MQSIIHITRFHKKQQRTESRTIITSEALQPSEDNLSDELLGARLVEVALLPLVQVVHHLERGLRVEDLVTEVSDQHHRLLKLKDRRHKPGPHFQPACHKPTPRARR